MSKLKRFLALIFVTALFVQILSNGICFIISKSFTTENGFTAALDT